jgi:hypothetical protein
MKLKRIAVHFEANAKRDAKTDLKETGGQLWPGTHIVIGPEEGARQNNAFQNTHLRSRPRH